MLLMLGLLVAIIVTFFVWSVIHELAHVLMAKLLTDVTDWKIKPYPQMVETNDGKRYFVWALSMWTYKGEVTDRQTAAIYLAPRIPDVVAAGLLQLYWIMPPSVWTLLFVVFCIGGIVDLAVGSAGRSDLADVTKASKALGMPQWILSAIGWVIALAASLPVLISAMKLL